MKINPEPPRRVRMMTTHDGKFLSLDDMKARLIEEGTQDYLLSLMAVGHGMERDPREIVQRIVGGFIMECAGEAKTKYEKPAEG